MMMLEKNLAALGAVDARLAEAIAAVRVAQGFGRVTAMDGVATFARVIEGAEGRRIEWLGGTSVPMAGAEAMVASLEIGTGNGLGLSMGTGYEWAEFARRLGGAQMVFVYEPEVALIRMALEVCDLAELLAARKVVLLTGDAEAAGAALVWVLTEQIGLEPPGVLHPLPSLGERRNGLLAAGETLVRRAVLYRQGQVLACAERLQRALGESQVTNEVPVAMTLTPRYRAERPVQGEIARLAARELRIDRHDATSLALRLQTLAEHVEAGGAWRVIGDLFRGQLGCVPEAMAVETWVPPLVGGAYWERARGMGAGDRVVVHAGAHAVRLREVGVADGQIELRPLARPVTTPAPTSGGGGLSMRHGVAVIGDLPACSFEALGIELPTHQAVVAAARAIVAEEFLTVHAAAAGDVLRRALLRAGVTGDDAALGEPMRRVVRDALIPAVALMTLVETLAEMGLAVRAVGDWPELEVRSNVERISFGAMTAEKWDEVAVLAHVSPTGAVSPLVWEAVANGVAIAAVEHPTDALFGSLAMMMKVGVARAKAGRFIGEVAGLLRDGARRRVLVEAAGCSEYRL